MNSITAVPAVSEYTYSTLVTVDEGLYCCNNIGAISGARGSRRRAGKTPEPMELYHKSFFKLKNKCLNPGIVFFRTSLKGPQIINKTHTFKMQNLLISIEQ